MIGENTLRRRVADRCGDPDDFFARYGHRFGRWLDVDPGTRPNREVEEVRSAVAGYLGTAVREGRRWGTAAGLVLGAVGAVAAFLLVWVIA